GVGGPLTGPRRAPAPRRRHGVTDQNGVNVEPLDDRHTAAWIALFDRCASPCFCRWWHFTGTKNEWLARCAEHRELNRDEQLALMAAHAPEATGLIAMEGERAIGWMK